MNVCFRLLTVHPDRGPIFRIADVRLLRATSPCPVHIITAQWPHKASAGPTDTSLVVRSPPKVGGFQRAEVGKATPGGVNK